MTPPATFVGAKCRWDTTRGVDRPENVSENVMLFPTSMRNAALPSVLIGGTSLSPRSVAEKIQVSARSAVASNRHHQQSTTGPTRRSQHEIRLIDLQCSGLGHCDACRSQHGRRPS